MREGIVFACVLNGQGGSRAPTDAELRSTIPADGVLWIHMDYRNAGAAQWLREQSGINSLAVSALLDEDSRPRMVQFDTGMLLILRGVNFNEGSHPEDMVSVRIWADARRVITTRRRKVRSPREIYEQLQQGDGPHTSGELLVRLANRLDAHIELVVENIAEEIDAAEARHSSGTESSYRGEFSQLRRKTASLRRYLSPQRDTLERLSRVSSELLNEHQRNSLREEADEITRHLEDLDLTRERAMVAQEELLNRLALEQNSRMYVLSMVAAIFLPLSFLTGLMGMNVAGLPGTQSPVAFAIICVLMIITAVLILVFFRWRKWL